MKNIIVADLMTRDPVTIPPETDLLKCAKTMVRKRVGSLLLVQEKRLVGILTQKDILWALIKKSKADLNKIKAIDISARKIATIKPTATIKETFTKMKKFKFERLPVIQQGELVGVITIKDILNFHPEIYPELNELSQIKEEAEKLKRIKKAQEREEGMCEECGNFDFLYREKGMLICSNCKDD